jgi:hypothetical protein
MTKHTHPILTALRRIDISPTQAALAEIAPERGKLQAADAAAFDRLTELAQKIADAQARGLNTKAAADALLAGDNVIGQRTNYAHWSPRSRAVFRAAILHENSNCNSLHLLRTARKMRIRRCRIRSATQLDE